MNKIYGKVTDKIIAEMEKGKIAWVNPMLRIRSTNLISGKAYRGLNIFLLAGWEKPYFMTYKQASVLGAQVKKGSKGNTVIFWQFLTKKEDKGKPADQQEKIPMLRYYNVFNVEDIENLPKKYLERIAESERENDNTPLIGADSIIKGYKDGPAFINNSAGRAFYRPSTDEISTPTIEQFENSREYYSTLFHEMGHSTGARSRLNRKDLTASGGFRSKSYAKEELTAELTAAFLMSETGETLEIKNHASYLQSWLGALKNDNTLLIGASSRAEKASDWILGR
jgi:antirestriction protein ArdC